MKVIIKKGRHMASNQFKSIRFGLFGLGTLGAIVSFPKQARYLTADPKNQPDWNKLFGCSWGFDPLIKQWEMHENSSRWVWRYDNNSGLFQLSPYIYINGLRIYKEIGNFGVINLRVDEPVFLCIVPDRNNQVVHFRYTKNISDVDKNGFPNNLITLDSIGQNIPSLAGFLDAGYFGGNETAPNQIEYNFIKIK